MLCNQNPCRRAALVLLLTLLVATAACGIKGDAMVIVDEGDSHSVRGKVTFSMNPVTGQMGPDLHKPGMLYVFRVDETIGDVSGKAGEVYKVNDNKELEKVGSFDLTKSDDDLAKSFGVDGD